MDRKNCISSSVQFGSSQSMQQQLDAPDPVMKRRQTLEHFRYEELEHSSDDFRLLVIHLAQSYDENIECQIFHASLNDQLDYSALSYCWGSDEKTSEIILNGKRFLITPNLKIALRDLRAYGRENPIELASIWIDAICIDQDNNTERLHQVGHMGSIYGRAERTIVWFGPMLDGFQFRIARALEELQWISEEEVLKFKDIIAERYGTPWSHQGRSGLEFSMYLVQAMFAHAWWSRIWVAQEIGLAKRVTALIGVRPILWSKIRGAIKTLLACCELVEWARISKGGCSSWETTLFRNVQRAAAIAGLGPGEGRRNRQHLCELLLDFQSQQASNLRDRVYGLMGLAIDYHRLKITPNYLTPLHMVSRVAMRELLHQNRNLLPLFLAVGVNRDAYQGVASWGLRLSHQSQPKLSLAALRDQFASENHKWPPLQKLRFHAGELNQSLSIDFSKGLENLVLTGYAIDTVLLMGSALSKDIRDHNEARIKWLPILGLTQYLPTISAWVQNPKDASTLIPPDTSSYAKTHESPTTI